MAEGQKEQLPPPLAVTFLEGARKEKGAEGAIE